MRCALLRPPAIAGQPRHVAPRHARVRRHRQRAIASLALVLATGGVSGESIAPTYRHDWSEARSGLAYAGGSLAAMQSDDVANPGMLWVDRGSELWRGAAVSAPACAGCHAEGSMRGVAARLPAWSAPAGRVVDLEDRINACRVVRQREAPLPRGGDDLLALSAFVASQSRGLPLHVEVGGPARPAFERAQAFYVTRRGQLDLSCANCHDALAGRRLGSETISQGHPTAFPAYRLEWQGLGSLHRRLRACLYGVRAALPDEGAQLLTELELFLAWRADGLPVEAPGVRR